jgi:hypothetical protein
MQEVLEEIDSVILEVDTSSINQYMDVSFSSNESGEDDTEEITMMVNSTINTNAVVAEAALLLLEDIYDNKQTKKGVVHYQAKQPTSIGISAMHTTDIFSIISPALNLFITKPTLSAGFVLTGVYLHAFMNHY